MAAPKVSGHNPMISIGPSVESIRGARQSVLAIMNTPPGGDAVKIEALKALHMICSVNDTTIQNCTFSP